MNYCRTAAELSVEDLEVIDSLCVAFEDSLQTGRSPSTEECLEDAPPDLKTSLFAELLLLEKGYLPPDVLAGKVEQYRRKLPHLKHVIEGVLTRSPRGSLQLGDRVGHYQVEAFLGAGSFGVIHRAIDTRTGQTVALKTARPGEFEQQSAELLQQEAELLSRLDHPSIIRIYDTVESEHGLSLVLPVFPRTLRELIAERPMNPADCVRALLPVVDAIGYAHANGVVHRDLEPGNLLIDDAGRCVISDFGLALLDVQQEAAAGETAGSIAYMSPEQVRGESHWLDGRADIWAIGVICYEAVSGRRPFAARDTNHLRDEILHKPVRPLRQIAPSCSPQLEQICHRCLTKSPEQRFQTAQDLRKALASTVGISGAIRRRPRLYSGLLLTTMLPVVFIVAPQHQNDTSDSQDAAAALDVSAEDKSPTVAADIHVEVIRNSESTTEWLPLPDAIPLRAEDRLKIQLQLSRPMFVAAWWIDVDGSLTQVYPESDSNHGSHQEQHEFLTLAASGGLSDGPSGTMTLVMVGLDRPFELNDLEQTARQLQRWMPQTSCLQQIARTHFGDLVRRRDRGTPGNPIDAEPAFWMNHRIFRSEWFEQFSVCQTLCIPFRSMTND